MVLKKGTQKKKTSLNDGRCNFCLAQEFLDDQVNRVLDLVTEGVPGALSWKKVLTNWRFQVTDIHLPEGRCDWHLSAPALGSTILRTELDCSSSTTPSMIRSWEVALNVAAWPPDRWPYQDPPHSHLQYKNLAGQQSRCRSSNSHMWMQEPSRKRACDSKCKTTTTTTTKMPQWYVQRRNVFALTEI